jgi:hypothetical protein
MIPTHYVWGVNFVCTLPYGRGFPAVSCDENLSELTKVYPAQASRKVASDANFCRGKQRQN